VAEPRVYELILWAMSPLPSDSAALGVYSSAYGRHGGARWGGPELPSRAAWAIMELPQPVGFALCSLLRLGLPRLAR